MSDQMVLIHEYSFDQMPKRKLLELFRKGAKLYRICENTSCDLCEKYAPISSDQELMTYCLRCGRKILRYGVEEPR